MGLSLISPKTPEVPKSEREAEKETRQKGNLSERERWGARKPQVQHAPGLGPLLSCIHRLSVQSPTVQPRRDVIEEDFLLRGMSLCWFQRWTVVTTGTLPWN